MDGIVSVDTEVARRQAGFDWISDNLRDELEAEERHEEAEKSKKSPMTIEEQISVLRGHWPKLNPDAGILELEGRPLVYGSDEPVAIPKWESLAPNYTDALEKEVFPALYSCYKGKFYSGTRFGRLGPDHMRNHERTDRFLRKINDRQKGDIMVIHVQTGLPQPFPGQTRVRHAGSPLLLAHKLFNLNEFGLTSLIGGCILLTHPARLVSHKDAWIDCAGEEYRMKSSGNFDHCPCFFFHAGNVSFSTFPGDTVFTDAAAATGFVIE